MKIAGKTTTGIMNEFSKRINGGLWTMVTCDDLRIELWITFRGRRRKARKFTPDEKVHRTCLRYQIVFTEALAKPGTV